MVGSHKSCLGLVGELGSVPMHLKLKKNTAGNLYLYFNFVYLTFLHINITVK